MTVDQILNDIQILVCVVSWHGSWSAPSIMKVVNIQMESPNRKGLGQQIFTWSW